MCAYSCWSFSNDFISSTLVDAPKVSSTLVDSLKGSSTLVDALKGSSISENNSIHDNSIENYKVSYKKSNEITSLEGFTGVTAARKTGYEDKIFELENKINELEK